MTMEAAGTRGRNKAGPILAALIIGLGVLAGAYALHRGERFISSDDATIDADVVHVASAVAGRIIELNARENQLVHKGDVLFRLDPEPYQFAVDQAEADLAIAQALLETRQRSIEVETANARMARDQIARAEANAGLAARTVDRLRPLAAQSFIPVQQLDQAQVAQRDAATSLAQARQQEIAALQAVGTLNSEEASVRARQAALAIARRALQQTAVVAPQTGRVTGLSILAGEFVAPGQSLFTLIGTEEWFIAANLRESELGQLKEGDCVTGYSMIDRRRPIRGVLESIGWGVLDDARINLPRALPYVERSMNWVRVAQRFPVRIRLIDPPEDLMRVGASAVVQVGYGQSCP